jgi:molecular chaperone GrpE
MSHREDQHRAPIQSDASEAKVPAAAESPEATPEVPSEIEQLRQQLEQLKEEAATNRDLFLRERAELENFKKRMQREKSEMLRFACEPLLRDLLPIVDNLERALVHGSGNDQSVIDGVQLILRSLLDVLERHGVTRIEAHGEPFDPSKHQAIAHVESSEHPPNHVAEQHLVGYQLQGRLLRPAMVSVSRGKAGAAVESPQNSD